MMDSFADRSVVAVELDAVSHGEGSEGGDESEEESSLEVHDERMMLSDNL